MRSFVRHSCFALPLLVVAANAAWADETPRPWSQAEVVALTEQLSAALDELVSDPGLDAQQATAYQQRNHQAAIASVKRVQPRVVELRKRVASGSDRDGSYPYFEQVAELREEIFEYAGEAWLPDTTRMKARRVRGLFERLARYYP